MFLISRKSGTDHFFLAVAQAPNDATLQGAIAAAWHH